MSDKHWVDYQAIVIAEDDVTLSLSLMDFFENVMRYIVRVVDTREDIMAALRDARAGWLLLDLELKDGLGHEIIPLVRNRYGDDVFVIVLTGQWERHTEDESLQKGADLVLRKPYPLSALKYQMERLMERVQKKPAVMEMSRKYRIGEGVIDVAQGIFYKGEQEIHLTPLLIRIIRLLMEKAKKADGWILRHELMMDVWGNEAIVDDMAKNTYGSRLRQAIMRINQTIGQEVVENMRGARRASFVRLLYEEYQEDAES
jgi:two-component system KDP operon response regulator KdpE